MMKEYYMDITMEQFKKELKFMDYEELIKVEDILNRCVFKKYDAEKILERLDAVNLEIMELFIQEIKSRNIFPTDTYNIV